jgi:hypothetical protein
MRRRALFQGRRHWGGTYRRRLHALSLGQQAALVGDGELQSERAQKAFPGGVGCHFADMAIFGHTPEKTRPLTPYSGARLLMRFRSTLQSSAWRGSSTDVPADNPSNRPSCLG